MPELLLVIFSQIWGLPSQQLVDQTPERPVVNHKVVTATLPLPGVEQSCDHLWSYVLGRPYELFKSEVGFVAYIEVVCESKVAELYMPIVLRLAVSAKYILDLKCSAVE